MRDLIPPVVARYPAEAAELVCVAVSDGDLEAALAQYEPPPPRGSGRTFLPVTRRSPV